MKVREMLLDKLSKYKATIGRVFMSMAAPEVFKGILLQFFAKEQLSVAKIAKYVIEKQDLWSIIPSDNIPKLRNLCSGLQLEWLTKEWLIQAISEDYPAIASYFISDPDADVWLDNQIKNIHEKLTKELVT